MKLVRTVDVVVSLVSLGGLWSCAAAGDPPGGGFSLVEPGGSTGDGNPGAASAPDASDASMPSTSPAVTEPMPEASAAAGPDASVAADAADEDADDGDATFYIPAPPTPDAATTAAPDATAASTAPDASSSLAVSSAAVPTIGGCAIYPANNPWNTRVDDPVAYPVHPSSATYITNMNPTVHLHADWGDWSTEKYGIPWQTVPASQPAVPMTFDDSSESDPGPYPFPPSAMVEGGANSGGDMHVLVLDTGTCTLYETWDSTYSNPGWSCGSGAMFDLTSNALRPDGWTSADAAGLPILPGLVRVSEVQAGAIRHAIRFTIANTQNGYIHPATHAAGKNNASLPPMGLRLRLKSSFDVGQFSGAAAVILTAMQQYGVILADNGTPWFVTGDSDDGWIPLMDNVNAAFGMVHGSDFEAVQTGAIQPQN